MLTVEYRINGQLIGYTNIHNEGNLPSKEDEEPNTIYSFCHIDNKKKYYGSLKHKKSEGFDRLVLKCLKKYISKENC
jgi:hypothetical protein